jgi:predicted transcriptional regulator
MPSSEQETIVIKSGIDQDAIINMFSQATAKQGEALRKAVSEATLKALQGRELSMENIRKVLKTVTEASSAGAALNPAGPVDIEAMLGKAFSGMDAAMLQAVQANRKALEQLASQGVDMQGKQMKTALANVEKMEDVFFDAVGKAVKGAGGPLQGPWEQVLSTMKLNGTKTGSQASEAIEQLLQQSRDAMRSSRDSSMKAAQTMMDSYSALVSGVLIGMSEGLSQGGAGAAGEGRGRKK